MANGTLGETGEHDWLAVTLAAGQAYEFTVTGLSNFASILVGTAAALDEGIVAVQNLQLDPSIVAPATQTVWFTPDTGGTYYVDVSDPATIGGYSASAVTVANDFPDNTTTTGVVAVGGAATDGTLGETGEHDWLAVTLAAGQAYEFTVTGLSNFASIRVGTAAALDEGIVAVQNLQLDPSIVAPATQTVWFTPDTGGTYYVDISDPATIGGYSASAVAVANDFPDNTATTGVVAVGGAATDGTLGETGEHDWLAVTLAAGQAYEFTVTGLSNFASILVGTAAALDEGIVAVQNLQLDPSIVAPATQTVWFTPDTGGTYYVDISDPATIGGYSASAVTVANDFPDNTATTGVVAVGGAATDGTLGETGEHDWLAVTLAAGQAYEFTVTGLSNFASIRVGTAAALDEGIVAVQNVQLDPSIVAPATQTVWFTPDTGGTYYVDISDPATIGGYSASAVTVANDFPDNTTTTGVVAVGGAATDGTLGETGEHDWLAVTLAAGQAYEFTVTGLSNFASIRVGTAAALDEGIVAVQNVQLDPSIVAPATQTVWFTPDTGGTYYVDISDPATIGGYSASVVTVANDFPDDTATTGVIAVLCFLQGTRIATSSGDLPVERLAVGDLVRTQRGQMRPITWIGVGRVLATRGRRSAATPVIVRKGALGDNIPQRDLHLTKGHALHVDGVLIPVEFLVNHRSILWDDRAQEVAVYHVELDVHDVLLANGAPAESYRDDGNRWLFQNANSGWGLLPKAPCAPILTGGPVVDAIWRRLLERAGARPSIPLTSEPDLHLLVDGKRIDAIERHDDRHVFRLAARPHAVRMCSRASIPQEIGIAPDARTLGVAVKRIVLAQHKREASIDASAASLVDGFHAFETNDGVRWTNGNAAVPAELFANMTGPCMLILHLGCTTRYADDGMTVAAA